VVYLNEKLEVLVDSLATGKCASAVDRHFGTNKSVMRSLKKNVTLSLSQPQLALGGGGICLEDCD
jgi:hypothetical protein